MNRGTHSVSLTPSSPHRPAYPERRHYNVYNATDMLQRMPCCRIYVDGLEICTHAFVVA